MRSITPAGSARRCDQPGRHSLLPLAGWYVAAGPPCRTACGAARSPIASTWSSSTSSGASFNASNSATPQRQANEKVASRPDPAQPSPSLTSPRRYARALCSAHQDRPAMVGWSQYLQPGSRTSPSIQRQVRAGAIGGCWRCRGGSRRGARVIAMLSTGRSAGRSPGRRGWVKTPARLSSHRAQAQGSRERLPGLVAASCGACGPPPKSHDSSSSRPCGNVT
jgi:hypothetical protein